MTTFMQKQSPAATASRPQTRQQRASHASTFPAAHIYTATATQAATYSLTAVYAQTHNGDSSGVISGYRYYKPELGRWVNRDPIEEQGTVQLLPHETAQLVKAIEQGWIGWDWEKITAAWSLRDIDIQFFNGSRWLSIPLHLFDGTGALLILGRSVPMGLLESAQVLSAMGSPQSLLAVGGDANTYAAYLNNPLTAYDYLGLLTTVGCPGSVTTEACLAAAEYVTEVGFKRRIQHLCRTGRVTCDGPRCRERPDRHGYYDPRERGIGLCPANAERACHRFTIGEMMVHEFAHEAGMGWRHPDSFHPHDGWGSERPVWDRERRIWRFRGVPVFPGAPPPPRYRR
jgi:RHS repeat-associated protein